MAVLDTLIKKMTLNDQEDEYYDCLLYTSDAADEL